MFRQTRPGVSVSVGFVRRIGGRIGALCFEFVNWAVLPLLLLPLHRSPVSCSSIPALSVGAPQVLRSGVSICWNLRDLGSGFGP
jgi:hypothetical protein